MNSSIVSFAFQDNSVRTAQKDDGSIWFCLGDCLKAMKSKTDPSNAKAALEDNLGGGTFTKLPIIDVNQHEQEALFVSESGVTFLLTRSRAIIRDNCDRDLAIDKFQEFQSQLDRQLLPAAA